MASLATYVKGFVGIAELADVPAAVWAQTESPRLRPIANEDVYLFVKRIEISKVEEEVEYLDHLAFGHEL